MLFKSIYIFIEQKRIFIIRLLKKEFDEFSKFDTIGNILFWKFIRSLENNNNNVSLNYLDEKYYLVIWRPCHRQIYPYIERKHSLGFIASALRCNKRANLLLFLSFFFSIGQDIFGNSKKQYIKICKNFKFHEDNLLNCTIQVSWLS